MNDASLEFNKQLELDVLLNGLSELTQDYVRQFDVYGINEVIIPEGVTSIDTGAFAFCIGLKRITIPDSVTSIGEYSFYNCRSLTYITIPKSVTSIKYSAFSGCYNLIDMTFKDKTEDEVRSMIDYPFSIFPENISVQVS